MPVLVVARDVTISVWYLAQLIATAEDLANESLPPLTEHRPPRGTFRTRREPQVRELQTMIPALVDRRSDLDIEALVFYSSGESGPCYVPDRADNDD